MVQSVITMIKVGTRGSPLATRQADGATSNLVQPYELITIKSQGDIDQKTPINEMGGKHVSVSYTHLTLPTKA